VWKEFVLYQIPWYQDWYHPQTVALKNGSKTLLENLSLDFFLGRVLPFLLWDQEELSEELVEYLFSTLARPPSED
jgi:hypothetical protein